MSLGLILIIVGIAGMILSLLYMLIWTPRRRGYERPVGPYEEPPPRW